MAQSDSKEIFSYRSNKIVNRFQGWIPNSIEDVEDFIENRISSQINQENSWFQFVILTKDENQIIGDIGMHFISKDNKVQL